jgi:hypothetical protein
MEPFNNEECVRECKTLITDLYWYKWYVYTNKSRGGNIGTAD